MNSCSADLLLITCNRRPYVDKTLDRLLSDPAEFRIFWWDNASTDGAADVVASCDDPRIVERHISKENVMQAIPTEWFLEKSQADIIGKVDDDTLVPHGWIDCIAPALCEHERLGMVGCLTFWPDDFERNRRSAERKVVRVGQHQVLRDVAIGGTGFLMRRELALKYRSNETSGRAFPVSRAQMTFDGYISGWHYPLLWAEHMDDPRSTHCLMHVHGTQGSGAALTARTRGAGSTEEYLHWIVSDVDNKLNKSVRRQLWEIRWRRSLPNRIFGLLKRGVACLSLFQ